jgi:anaerobic C4-dicarboxylate transporter DcuB
VLLETLWSLRRGKDLADDPEFQRKIDDPDQFALIYGTDETLLAKRFPKEAFRSTWIFFAGIAAVVVLGAFANLRRSSRSTAPPGWRTPSSPRTSTP